MSLCFFVFLLFFSSHLLRECQDTALPSDVAKVRRVAYELKMFVVSSSVASFQPSQSNMAAAKGVGFDDRETDDVNQRREEIRRQGEDRFPSPSRCKGRSTLHTLDWFDLHRLPMSTSGHVASSHGSPSRSVKDERHVDLALKAVDTTTTIPICSQQSDGDYTSDYFSTEE